MQTPEYSVNEQTHTLVVQHGGGRCNAKNLSVPLTYNAKSKVKGVLGYAWSLGIESTIIQKDEKTLLYFDAKKGTTNVYVQEEIDKQLFNYKGNIIRKVNWGYLYACNDVEQQFNTKGKLTSITFSPKSYSFEYKNEKLHKILLHEDIYAKPYMDFEYLDNGVSLTYHKYKEKRKVIFLQNEKGYLKSVEEDTRVLYRYVYNLEDKLRNVYSDTEKIFDFLYLGDISMLKIRKE